MDQRQNLLALHKSEIEQIFSDQFQQICKGVDKLLVFLMGAQWLCCILIALFFTPTTWLGLEGQTNEWLAVAVVCGGVFFFIPVFSVWIMPGQRVARHMITTGQMLFSVLFIFLTGGRLEAHFHIFISLAFIAFYKEAGLLWYGGALMVLDHYIRGLYFPMSIYGDIGGAASRWKEHAFWISIENVALSIGIIQARRNLLDLSISKFEILKAREAALRTAQLKSEFLSFISHEIRTPLSSVIGFSELLGEAKLDSEKKNYSQIIHRCSQSLAVLINDILDLSKIENGLLKIDHHEFDFRELHKEVIEIFSIQCREKGIFLNTEVSDDIPQKIVGDSNRIRQILMNLIGNAVKFTHQGGITVRINCESTVDGIYRWQIIDTGIGIAKENISKLFNPFTQENSSVFRKYGGTGLGLVITKQLLHLMDGHISIESQLGKGSTATFTLKLQSSL